MRYSNVRGYFVRVDTHSRKFFGLPRKQWKTGAELKAVVALFIGQSRKAYKRKQRELKAETVLTKGTKTSLPFTCCHMQTIVNNNASFMIQGSAQLPSSANSTSRRTIELNPPAPRVFQRLKQSSQPFETCYPKLET